MPQPSGLGLTKIDDLPIIQYKYVPQTLPIIILRGLGLSLIIDSFLYSCRSLAVILNILCNWVGDHS
jgi:type VI protein secretion system component VasA